jgi:aspartate 1-decarboxylase
MERTLLKSKIHRATVTDADLNYEGSVTIDATLIQAANLVPYEQVDIYDITNGSRLTTYVIEGEADSGEICINGAAAHHVKPGDLVIIAAYARVSESELETFQPRIIQVNEHNQVAQGHAVESA